MGARREAEAGKKRHCDFHLSTFQTRMLSFLTQHLVRR
jgi:hypothetical protein